MDSIDRLQINEPLTPEPLEGIHRSSLRDAVVARIREAIEIGHLRAGEQLIEMRLAKKLGVAQATIREALLELEFLGYVEPSAPRKTRVTCLTRRDVDNLYLVRIRLETLAAELVAAQRPPQLQSCWEPLAEMEAHAKSVNLVGFCRSDLEFHRALWRSSQNECLESALERVVPKLFAFGIIQHARPSSAKLIETAELHRRLLTVMADGDLEATRRLMELSMEKAWLDDVSLPELG
jgi:altronate dehydratase small subunit